MDSISKRILSRMADRLRRWITGEKIHDAGCTFKAFRREALRGINLYGEMHRFLSAMLYWKGFKVTEIKVTHHPRKHGKSKYSITKVIRGFLDLLVVKFWMEYSARPIHLFGGIGLMLSGIGMLIGLYLTAIKLMDYTISIANRPLLLLSVLLIIVGFQFLLFGILADILIKLYYNEGNEPYHIEKVYK